VGRYEGHKQGLLCSLDFRSGGKNKGWKKEGADEGKLC